MTQPVAAPGFPRAAHHSSHRELLRTVTDAGPTGSPDAVVISAARPAAHLHDAAELAADLGCLLLAMCSNQAKASDVAVLAAEWPGLRWLAVDLPTGYRHRWLNFETSTVADVKVRRLGDLSVKRNLGLLLGWLARWSSVMFLDDDIRGIDPATVRRAAGALNGRITTVGMTVDDYPDNSVVCHANRLTTGRQGVFVSGSALLVRCDRAPSFFPEVYNEDWLFLFDSVADRAVAKYGTARQLPYDPFEDPARAASEEFGDVLAEGLLALLHDAAALRVARDASYWRRFLRSRLAFIERSASSLTTFDADEVQRAALLALAAAEQRCRQISPTAITRYIRTWRRDRALWAERLAVLDRPGNLDAALRMLGLHECSVGSEREPTTAVGSRLPVRP